VDILYGATRGDFSFVEMTRLPKNFAVNFVKVSNFDKVLPLVRLTIPDKLPGNILMKPVLAQIEVGSPELKTLIFLARKQRPTEARFMA